MLSELLLLQRARCERPERAYAARMDHLQQRCKQQRPLRSHSSTRVQLDAAMSGDMMSSRCLAWRRGLDGSDGGASESTFEGAVLQRLRVGGRARHRWNAPESADTIRTTPTPCANVLSPFSVRTKYTSRRVVHAQRSIYECMKCERSVGGGRQPACGSPSEARGCRAGPLVVRTRVVF